jgi:hypothetical protein
MGLNHPGRKSGISIRLIIYKTDLQARAAPRRARHARRARARGACMHLEILARMRCARAAAGRPPRPYAYSCTCH